MKQICIQSGHWNVTSGQTGAPMEQVRTLAIGLKLVDLLRKQGYIVYHTDSFANLNKDVTGKDWDLFLALHCDMDYAGTEGGGFADFPEPSTDQATSESQRIVKAIESVYFKESGIRNVPSRRNANTKYYYMWSALSAKTPCAILEMGESIDPHDSVILNDTERVAKAILGGINKAFPGAVVPPTPEPPTDPCANLRDDFSRVSASLLNAELDRDKALNSQKTLLTENADLKRKLIDIQKILNG